LSSLLDTLSDIVAIIMLLLCRYILLLLHLLTDCIIYGLSMLYLFVLQVDTEEANLSLLLLLCTSCALFNLLFANALVMWILIDRSTNSALKKHHRHLIAIENIISSLFERFIS